MFKHILIPTDGSQLSNEAITAGIELAKVAGAKVTGFFAAPAPTPVVYQHFIPVAYLPPEEHAAMIEKAAQQYLSVLEDAARRAGIEYELEHTTNDFPAEAIIDVAKRKKCDLIFMASHGRRGRKGVLLGSVTREVLAHATIPVLIFRMGAA
jgi:nucleotide-binding universal stress UspA family protein